MAQNCMCSFKKTVFVEAQAGSSYLVRITLRSIKLFHQNTQFFLCTNSSQLVFIFAQSYTAQCKFLFTLAMLCFDECKHQ